MNVYRFGRYVADQVFGAADEYRILFGFHLLETILGIWPPSSSTINEYQKYKHINNK